MTNILKANGATKVSVNDNVDVNGVLTVVGNEVLQGSLSATSDLSTSTRVLTDTLQAKSASQVTLNDNVDVVGALSAPSLKVFNLQTSSGTSTKTGNPVSDSMQIRNLANQLLLSVDGASKSMTMSTSLTCTQPAYFGAVETTSVKLGANDLQAALDDKQRKFITGPCRSRRARRQAESSTWTGIYFRCLQVNWPLSIATSGNSHLSLSCGHLHARGDRRVLQDSWGPRR
jgi:hypothetical protein